MHTFSDNCETPAPCLTSALGFVGSEKSFSSEDDACGFFVSSKAAILFRNSAGEVLKKILDY